MESRPRAVEPPAFLVAIVRDAYTLREVRYTGFEYSTEALSVKIWFKTSMIILIQKIRSWCRDNAERLLVLVGVLLVSVLSFQAGLIQGKLVEEKSFVIHMPMVDTSASPAPVVEKKASNVSEKTRVPVDLIDLKSCPLVGSKNSNKYHVPTCAVAKRIKPENKVCFASEEIARARGYISGCLK